MIIISREYLSFGKGEKHSKPSDHSGYQTDLHYFVKMIKYLFIFFGGGILNLNDVSFHIYVKTTCDLISKVSKSILSNGRKEHHLNRVLVPMLLMWWWVVTSLVFYILSEFLKMEYPLKCLWFLQHLAKGTIWLGETNTELGLREASVFRCILEGGAMSLKYSFIYEENLFLSVCVIQMLAIGAWRRCRDTLYLDSSDSICSFPIQAMLAVGMCSSFQSLSEGIVFCPWNSFF